MTNSLIVPQTPEARRTAIQHGLEDLAPVIIEAYKQRDWEHFGFATWSEYLADFGQLRLPRLERQSAVEVMRREGMSQPAIAEALGVSQPTVHADLALIDSDKLPDRITGLDGKDRPRSRPHVAANSGENEWYTPPHIIEAAVEVMGAIDLDPASSSQANASIGATDFYTINNSGLTHQWHGRVWLNPPYASDLVSRFVDKLVEEYVIDRVTEACLLSNNATETKWFQHAVRVANAVCFPEGRLSYWYPDRTSKTPLQGQAIIYYGPHTEKFRTVFGQLGSVLRT